MGLGLGLGRAHEDHEEEEGDDDLEQQLAVRAAPEQGGHAGEQELARDLDHLVRVEVGLVLAAEEAEARLG